MIRKCEIMSKNIKYCGQTNEQDVMNDILEYDIHNVNILYPLKRTSTIYY